MNMRTIGAAPWLILVVTACSSSTTTQNVINLDAGVDKGGSSSAGGKTSSGGATAIGGTSANTAGTSATASVGGATAMGGSSAGTAGGSTPTGGASATGGATSIVGTTATGGSKPTGGASATGGTTSIVDTTATGGSKPTGGAPTGGAPTGGAPTGGAPAINQFANGPCVTSPDLSNLEVFASSGQNIYRRAITSTSSGAWTRLANLDATKLDIRSDLDCTASSNNVHIVATGSSPVGSYMHAFGFGTAYNAFTRELSTYTPSTFDPPGASIATWLGSTDTRYQMAAAGGNPVWVFVQSSTMTTDVSPANTYSLTSAPDIAIQQATDASHFEMVAFLAVGTMAYYDFSFGYSSSWLPTVFTSPPASTTYTYSPTICTQSDSTSGDFTRHVAAVAGGKLYYAHSGMDWTNGTTFSGWEVAGTALPASSPDCVVTSDNTVHIVVLTSAGTIAHVSRTGTSGNWTTADLGGF